MDNYNFNLKDFGHRLKKARVEAGLLQDDFASRLGLSGRTLLEIEAGRTEVKVSFVFLVAKELKISVYFLLGIPEGNIVNSFNSIKQEANSQQGINHTHISIDKEWLSEIIRRFTFYEEQIQRKDELLEFFKNEIKR